MNLFQSTGLTALGAACALAFSAPAAMFAQEKKVDRGDHHRMMEACAKACSDCQRACDQCATHCTHELHGGKTGHLAALSACRDCATVCSAASQVAARGGPYSTHICTVCADVCAACAKECNAIPNDKHMAACAAECLRCEKSCRDMVKHMER